MNSEFLIQTFNFLIFIYKLLEDYVSGEKIIKPKHNNTVKVKGI